MTGHELRSLIRDHGSYSYGLGNLLWLIIGNLAACVLACSSTHVHPEAIMPVPGEGFIPLVAMGLDAIAVYVFLAGTQFGMHSVPLIFLAVMTFVSPAFDAASYFRVIAVVADLMAVVVLLHLYGRISAHVYNIEARLPPEVLADIRAEEAEEAY